MKTKIILIMPLVMLMAFQASAGKKEKKGKIKSTTELLTEYTNGKPVTYKQSYEEFDKNGNTVQFVEFRKDGSIKHKETFTYDAANNLTDESLIDVPSGKVSHKAHKYTLVRDKYRELEETSYNADGTILKKNVYTYTATAKKASETTYDGNGKLVKKTVFSYNSKDLHTSKQILDESGAIKEDKEWQYVYF
jgi:hypothetical protein